MGTNKSEGLVERHLAFMLNDVHYEFRKNIPTGIPLLASHQRFEGLPDYKTWSFGNLV
jgi:hypothetical protein